MTIERLTSAESGARALASMRPACGIGTCARLASCPTRCRYRDALGAVDVSMTSDPFLLRPSFPVLSNAVHDEEYRASTERPGERREAPPPTAQALRDEQIAGPRELVYGGAIALIMASVAAFAFFSTK